MKPGLGRAVGAGILGFLGSVLFVIILRYLQSVEPVFDAQIAMILAAFVSSFAFIWGAGGTDPRMSQHPHEPEVDAETGLILVQADDHAHEEELDAANDPTVKPAAYLTHAMWQVAFFTVLLVVGLFSLATLPFGPLLRTTGDPQAAAEAIGFYTTELPLLGEVVMSQLTLFVLLVITLLVILGALGSGLALAFTSLSRNLTEVREQAPTRFAFVSETEANRKPFLRDLGIALALIGTYILLYDFMVRGSMRFNMTITLVLIAISIGLGVWLTIRRTRGMDSTDALIEAIKVNSMTAALIFHIPVLYIVHYEALVGFIFTTPILRVLLSLGAAFTLAPVLTFVLYNDTASDIIIKSARALRKNLRGEDAASTTSTALVPVDTHQSLEVEVAES